ncbi:uncharacterized protein CcaverHIS019_0107030 [Cutaneotrichosporon cavernicola]|uniref:ABC protein n=1 Tax=Cutaneotrichosporon cavernicola TaxID=279322 RepID=A0AA48I507_9TREE|nr:uncharacterized protein CcaverHIS019_0107030 [Cutaneotrichosporon cavernicola]BEI87985.1 hypothetical protein CcaverHIS019_0107030 [Cutaneotrichosporon cavernicola]
MVGINEKIDVIKARHNTKEQDDASLATNKDSDGEDGKKETHNAENGEDEHMRLRDMKGEYSYHKRDHWWQLWRPSKPPPPPPESFADAPELPLAKANFLSVLTFHWVSPLMRLGYQRPLQATDLWRVDPSREADYMSTKFLNNLENRQAKAKAWNESLPTAKPPLHKRVRWAAKSLRPLPDEAKKYESGAGYGARRAAFEAEWRADSGKKHGSIAGALNEAFPRYWLGGLFKLVADEAQLMAPLLIKEIIRFSQATYAAKRGVGEKPHIGRGIGLAFGLLLLSMVQSVCQHQFFFRSMTHGALFRATLISATYKRALRLSVGARRTHPNGTLMAYLSSDISRIDYCAHWFHVMWTAPIQLAVTLILLCLQIGPSAIVGFVVFVILAPVQTYFMRTSFKVRKGSMKWTDGRSKLLSELLASMQIIKAFCYELPFLKRLAFVRGQEMTAVRKLLFIRAGNQALAYSVPVMAAVLSFVTYSSTHENMDPALIFTSLAYFNLLRQPLMFLPRALSTLADAQAAVLRLESLFEAPLMDEKELINPDLDVAIRAKNATFQWATVLEPETVDKESGVGGRGGRGGVRGGRGGRGGKVGGRGKRATETKMEQKNDSEEKEPFMVQNLSLEISRGQLVAIVGPVGAGKSSILQGLLGEMRHISGTAEFGGRLGYCQQTAWIQNATLRDNVLFGQRWDEARYWECIRRACLLPDLEILPDGDLTEIGEKGVNLSGGQKQRVNIARALYFDADTVLFDDPLSAVDAHVGRLLFNEAVMGLRAAGKTVVLVTHALHFLPQVDYVYMIQHGHVVEEGTYDALLASEGPFRRLVKEFGGTDAKQEEDGREEGAIEEAPVDTADAEAKAHEKFMGCTKAAGTGKLEGRLMTSEVRKTGRVGGKVYGAYLRAGNATWMLPPALLFAAAMQAGSVLSTVWLTWWEADTFGRSTAFYQGMYAMLGLAATIFIFGLGVTMGVMAYFASRNLYGGAVRNVFFAPMSFFDTQPLGRIMGVFGKDIDIIDNQLPDSLRLQVFTLLSLIGSVVIITVYFHYFIAIIFVVGVGYWYFAQFYRTSAREVKRLDSMLRSLLYSHFSESLSGLATIRAYGETDRFVRDNCYYMDLEDRAYILTSSNQRWLAVRLDFLGALLVFAVAIMSVAGGTGLSASQIALCLTYMTQITQILGMVTRQSAEVENNMNAVERIQLYAGRGIPQEAAYEVKDDPPPEWPTQGAVTFDDVVMSYRKGLQPVLKGISARFEHGEKVGIIGRTGAGKTSITVALFRLAELTSGRVTVDGVDVSSIGLKRLRSAIAIIPQDPVLFSGTLRTNLDPFDEHTDAELHDAMGRACLLEEEASRRFTLDMAIDDEGSNLSIGERSLVSLARALVKDARIVVLDEATAAVDLETDAKIQQTIRREFGHKTLLCIAHRLRTILSWDRILVMDAGQIVDFDTPLELYDRGGHFRSMCERSSITREEIERARQEETFS